MKGLLLTIYGILITTLTFAEKPALLLADADNGNGTTGYSNGATMGLIIIIVLVVIGIAGFTWRKKKE